MPMKPALPGPEGHEIYECTSPFKGRLTASSLCKKEQHVFILAQTQPEEKEIIEISNSFLEAFHHKNCSFLNLEYLF